MRLVIELHKFNLQRWDEYGIGQRLGRYPGKDQNVRQQSRMH
jgi:hypothetical protein